MPVEMTELLLDSAIWVHLTNPVLVSSLPGSLNILFKF